MLALVWLLYFSFGVTVGSLPPLVTPIVEDLGLTYGQMGLVLGAWQLIYIATASPLGALVDRLGVRRSLALGTAVVWLSLVSRGLAVDLITLFMAVALFGFGGPIISIGAPKMVSVWFRGRERGMAAGIYATGPVAGTTFALATAGSVVLPLTGTWRGISVVYGVLVLVILVTWLLAARDAPTPAGGARRDEDGFVGVARQLLGLRTVRIVLPLAVGTFFVNHALNGWAPALLEERGMSLARAGQWTAASTALGALGLLLVPGLSRPGRRGPTLALLLAGSALASAVLAVARGAALVSALLLSAALRRPMSPLMNLVLMETCGIGPPRMGAASGLLFAAAEVGGFGGPLALGLLRDATGSLTAGMALLAAVAAFMALLTLAIPETQVRRVTA